MAYGYMKPKMYTSLFKYLTAEKDFIPMYVVDLAIKNIKKKLYRLETVKFSGFAPIQVYLLFIIEVPFNK